MLMRPITPKGHIWTKSECDTKRSAMRIEIIAELQVADETAGVAGPCIKTVTDPLTGSGHNVGDTKKGNAQHTGRQTNELLEKRWREFVGSPQALPTE